MRGFSVGLKGLVGAVYSDAAKREDSNMAKKVAVIDGNSLMHRAYHAVPPNMTAPDGTPTNAAFGFMSMLLKFIDMAQPDALVCAFDRGKPAFRIEAMAQYKAQRPPMDDELRVQFPLIEKLLEAMGIPVVALKGWEGDDILGTIAARDEALGYETLLVTGDKDAYQLASDLTRIVTTKRGITDVVIYGPAEVEDRYGVTPDQFIDFLGLKGDKADNIPGVPGIGDKRAAAMLQEYGNLEGIYDHLDAFKGKQRENLETHKEDAFLSREVATIVRTVDFELDLEALSFPSFDPQSVTEAFKEVRFMAHLSKILALTGTSSAEQTSAVALEGWKPLLEGEEAYAALDEQKQISSPIIAWSRDAQVSLFDSGLSVAVNTPKGTALFHGDDAENVVVSLLREGPVVTYDAKALLATVFPPDTSLPARLEPEEVLNINVFDVALAAYVVDSNNGLASLPELLERYTATLLSDDQSDASSALAMSAAAIRTLIEPLERELEEREVRTVYDTIDAPLIGVLACMERTGAAVDVEHLSRLATSTAAELDRLCSDIFAAAGQEFNIDSPKQLAKVLFEDIGLTPIKKNQRGYSTDAQVLKELSKVHELPALVLRYREYAKIKSTYIDALPRMIAPDGCVHTTFHEMVTTTGRLSSSDPNLQNIPVRTEFGRNIRECFIPQERDSVFLSADYSQIELRLLAHLSADEHLIDEFLSGEDFHTRTASRVFGVSLDEVTPLLRSRAKAVNFGIVYGQQAFGLAQSLDIPFYDAKEMIDRYFEAYPGVRTYLDTVVAQAYREGYATTLFGRRRYIPELKAKSVQRRNFGERTAMNHPMQGTAADIIKLAMRQVQNELVARKLQTRLMLQVHDELDFTVPLDEVEEVSSLVHEIMQSVVELSVPLLVDISYGKTWAEAH